MLRQGSRAASQAGTSPVTANSAAAKKLVGHGHVWLGVSAENQDAADERIPHLLATPAAVRFVSLEPLLGAVDISAHLGLWRCSCCGDAMPDGVGTSAWRWSGRAWEHKCPGNIPQAGHFEARRFGGLDWVMVGGESGPKARPCDAGWVGDIVDQCQAASVPVFVKQLGARPEANGERWYLRDRKGGNPLEWPPAMQVREWPEVRA